ncbi:twin-arginine translocation signal domain-containing protein [Halalkalibaculum sp. DA384]|uniref:twin-arginine translocation signal domain-containing protein n=1 Tax=Halalkalibaculum sp. DA384 TaxID=3373606 RepID=UPI0037549738
MNKTRREFLKQVAAAGTAFAAPGMVTNFDVNINTSRSSPENDVIGHGDFRYRVEKDWAALDPARHPVKNCHEMVMDKRGRLIMITDETQNNIIIFNKDGKYLDSWGSKYPGGHGLTLWNAGGEEFLFITDTNAETARVEKTTLDGRVLLTLEDPREVGGYDTEDDYLPTETAVGPDGTIYVADGYGSFYVLRFSPDGKYLDKFGGAGSADDQLNEPHGVAVDTRSNGTPTLLVTSRRHNSFKRFTLEGEYLETIFLPGAYVCRPVINGENVYAGVCWSRKRYLNLTPESGFITILDKDDNVVSNPAGTQPSYINGELQLMVQEESIFKHCHDVCIDEDKNMYVCQWNAGQTYPIKLHRV